jgi:signal transduction histidine kinase
MTYQPSMRLRLTVWYALALAAGLLIFALGIWLSMRASLLAGMDASLADRALSLESFLKKEMTEIPLSALPEELDDFSHGLPQGTSVEIRKSSGQLFYSYQLPKDTSGYRVQGRHGPPFEIRVYASVAPIDALLSHLRMLLLACIPVVILIASFGGYWLSRRALRPVDDITKAARTISIENLSRRLTVPQTGDELQRLSETWNGMLSHLEVAVNRLSRFTADASHELRTPLAVIRTTAELAARRARSPESYRDALNEITAEAERMTRLVEDLLFLARCDAGNAGMPLAALDLAPLVRDACAKISPLAEAKNITLSAALTTAPATGNEAALRRLIFALLDNAIKYSGPGGDVSVELRAAPRDLHLIVRDHGAGIPVPALPHIFDRFYQADKTHSGYGLGLSLADSIARSHRARIEVTSVPGEGATFDVIFPALLP